MTLSELSTGDKLLLTVEEAGEALALGSRRTAYRAAADGSLPTVRIAGRLYVPVPRLMRLLGADPPGPTPDTEAGVQESRTRDRVAGPREASAGCRAEQVSRA